MKRFLLNALVWGSQTVNVLVLAGHPDQTVSARAFVNRDTKRWGVAYKAINTVFFWQDDHCLTSHQEDLLRAKAICNQEV
ncbi:hypothetical protein [Kineobactrum salinum]|uniref:Uncharacterized protein n=1 Tax=Kineobactrum salinum TaxID=2708301 RepID=A0A6C0UB39_9GAMM|nr:hypothetical protein [Kineobactrum salinum]QIB67184.1 hypothetical protein G3T16_19010 [Kineobactrum salinum]